MAKTKRLPDDSNSKPKPEGKKRGWKNLRGTKRDKKLLSLFVKGNVVNHQKGTLMLEPEDESTVAQLLMVNFARDEWSEFVTCPVPASLLKFKNPEN